MKPREWWIDYGDYSPDDYFEYFVSARDPQTLSDDQDYMGINERNPVHVIEKRAYDELMKQAEAMAEALIREREANDIGQLLIISNEALENWQKFKEQK